MIGIYMFYTNQLSDYESAGSMGLFRNIGGTEYLETRSWTRTEINVVRSDLVCLWNLIPPIQSALLLMVKCYRM